MSGNAPHTGYPLDPAPRRWARRGAWWQNRVRERVEARERVDRDLAPRDPTDATRWDIGSMRVQCRSVGSSFADRHLG